jgi:hypothetical protein
MATMQRILPFTAFTLLASSLGCVEAGAPENPGVQIDTLPTGTFRVTNSGDPAWTPESAWTLVEDLRLGSVSGAGPSLFAQVAAILTDDEGNIYVLDYPTQEMRVFSSSGDHLRTIGGEGEGPGELRGAAGLNWGPDGRLWVWGSSSYYVLGRTGEEVVRYQRLPRGVIYSWQGGFDDQGRYIDWGLDRETLATTRTGSEHRAAVFGSDDVLSDSVHAAEPARHAAGARLLHRGDRGRPAQEGWEDDGSDPGPRPRLVRPLM